MAQTTRYVAGGTFLEQKSDKSTGIFAETASLMGSQVHLIPTTSSLAKGLGEIASTGPRGWTQAHRTSNVIDGAFIKEIIVHRSALDAA